MTVALILLPSSTAPGTVVTTVTAASATGAVPTVVPTLRVVVTAAIGVGAVPPTGLVGAAFHTRHSFIAAPRVGGARLRTYTAGRTVRTTYAAGRTVRMTVAAGRTVRTTQTTEH
jgi:hypothetical protein